MVAPPRRRGPHPRPGGAGDGPAPPKGQARLRALHAAAHAADLAEHRALPILCRRVPDVLPQEHRPTLPRARPGLARRHVAGPGAARGGRGVYSSRRGRGAAFADLQPGGQPRVRQRPNGHQARAGDGDARIRRRQIAELRARGRVFHGLCAQDGKVPQRAAGHDAPVLVLPVSRGRLAVGEAALRRHPGRLRPRAHLGRRPLGVCPGVWLWRTRSRPLRAAHPRGGHDAARRRRVERDDFSNAQTHCRRRRDAPRRPPPGRHPGGPLLPLLRRAQLRQTGPARQPSLPRRRRARHAGPRARKARKGCAVAKVRVRTPETALRAF
mmetsp:Transcript_15104/g.50723  ORF Transcript_15104/g.50723 Transcript_15104/m.50723 type:complete len:325 (+) Transcript_15104:631-1605(+)